MSDAAIFHSADTYVSAGEVHYAGVCPDGITDARSLIGRRVKVVGEPVHGESYSVEGVVAAVETFALRRPARSGDTICILLRQSSTPR